MDYAVDSGGDELLAALRPCCTSAEPCGNGPSSAIGSLALAGQVGSFTRSQAGTCSTSTASAGKDAPSTLGGQAATPAASPAAPALRDQLRSSTLGDQEGASASEDPSLLGLNGVSKWFLASSFEISK